MTARATRTTPNHASTQHRPLRRTHRNTWDVWRFNVTVPKMRSPADRQLYAATPATATEAPMMSEMTAATAYRPETCFHPGVLPSPFPPWGDTHRPCSCSCSSAAPLSPVYNRANAHIRRATKVKHTLRAAVSTRSRRWSHRPRGCSGTLHAGTIAMRGCRVRVYRHHSWPHPPCHHTRPWVIPLRNASCRSAASAPPLGRYDVARAKPRSKCGSSVI